MDIDLSPAEIAFQNQVRAWLAANLPDRVRDGAAASPTVFVDPDVGQDWNAVLNAQGWLGYQWPVEHGGTGWTPVERYLFEKECAAAGAPNLTVLGLKNSLVFLAGEEACIARRMAGHSAAHDATLDRRRAEHFSHEADAPRAVIDPVLHRQWAREAATPETDLKEHLFLKCRCHKLNTNWERHSIAHDLP